MSATKTVAKRTFTVSQEDIDNGLAGDPNACPIVMAAKRMFPYGTCCTGSNDLSIGVRGVGGYPIFFGFFPPEARKFIKDFDKGKSVKPFSFMVEDWTALCFVESPNASRSN